MTSLLVDSSVWIAYLRGDATREARLLDGLLARHDAKSADRWEAEEPPTIVVADMVLLEVLRGIDDDGEHARVRAALFSFEQVRLGGTEIALAACDHYRALRRFGITVRKAIDCLIAAWCIANRTPLLHADRDFAPFVAHRGLVSL